MNIKSDREPIALRILNWVPLAALLFFGLHLFLAGR